MAQQQPATIAEAVGGVRGVIDSAAPTVVFVTANSTAGLRAGIIAAVVTGVAVFALRLLRRQPVRQAVGGFAAVAVAAYFAARTHKAEGFFLPGIILSAVYAAAAGGSALFRRPFVGYVLAALDVRYAHWQRSPRLVRAAMAGTLVWTGVFALRAGIQGWLYLHSHVGWLAAARIGMGLPLFAAATGACVLLARRAAALDRPALDGLAPNGPLPHGSEHDDVVAVDDLPLVRRSSLGGQLPGGASQEGG